MAIKINSFELENVKRVKAVAYEPSQTGLTVIGGKNGQGKTSVLDAIAWTLGGAKFRPSMAEREGSYNSPKLEVKLSNGLIVTRSGANNTLKVVDPDGRKSGQKILDEFIGQLALDLPKFIAMTPKEKAEELLKLLGVEEKLTALALEYNQLYSKRHAIGQIATQKEKYAAELPVFDDVPAEPVSASDLIKAQQEILLRNAENQKKRGRVREIQAEYDAVSIQINQLEEKLRELHDQQARLADDLTDATKSAENLTDESTAELEAQIANVDAINQRVRANQEHERAVIEAGEYKTEYNALTEAIEDVKQKKADLLNSVKMPLDELSIEDGELTFKGKKWDCMSGAEQLKVSTAIVQALNPQCGFVLMDKLEQMDADCMREFGEWLEEKGLQVIATRVTTNAEECSIIITDGRIEGAPVVEEIKKDWGEF